VKFESICLRCEYVEVTLWNNANINLKMFRSFVVIKRMVSVAFSEEYKSDSFLHLWCYRLEGNLLDDDES